MAETDSKSILDGIREILMRFVEQASTREALARIEEREKQWATREQVNDGDLRTLQEVSTMFDRSTAANQQFVRDRVEESQLRTANALQVLEKSTGEKLSAIEKSADAAKVAAQQCAAAIAEMRQQQQQPPAPQIGRTPLFVPWGGGIGLGGILVYLLLAFFGFAPRPGG